MKLNEVIALIDEDISFQATYLNGTFNNDRGINWRITGMEDLKKKILALAKKEKKQ